MTVRVGILAGKPEVNVVRFSGRLDTTSSEAAQPVILGALEKSAAGVLLHMSSLEFVSSAGLRILLMLMKKAGAEGKHVAVIDAQPAIYKIFKVAGLDKIFRFFEDEADALKQLWP